MRTAKKRWHGKGEAMIKKIPLLLVIAFLISAQLACNMPLPGLGGSTTQIPGPEQTLTALFSITPVTTLTASLPPIHTATSIGTIEPDGRIYPTATNTPSPYPTLTNTPSPYPTLTNIPSPYPTHTNVPPPQPTSTIPFTRPHPVVLARYLATPPIIDGDWSEWKNITTEYPANFIVWGNGNYTGEDDLSSSFHVGWDNNYLYIAVKVHDDKYVQNATGANIYKGDSLELLLDTNLQGDYYYQQLSADDYQLGISPGRPNPDGPKEAFLWFPSNIAGSRSNVTIGARQENGIYRVEAAIPWSVFEMTPVNNSHYGFAISVSDNDDPMIDVQQSMASNVPGRRLTDPTTWGDLQLIK
jgi:hypothetical protein